MTDFKLKWEILKAQIHWAPGALTLGPSPGLCSGPTGRFKALCRPPADFFISLAWEKAFSFLQTQFGMQKQWYDKVLGKIPASLCFVWRRVMIVL